MSKNIIYNSLEEWLNVLETFFILGNKEYTKRNNINNPMYEDFIYTQNYIKYKLDKNTNKKLTDILNKYKISKFVDFWGSHFNMLILAIRMNSHLKVMYKYNFPYNDTDKLNKKLVEIDNIASRDNIQIKVIPLNVKDYLAFFKLKCHEVFLENKYLFDNIEINEKNKLKNGLIRDFILAIVSDNYINNKKFNSNIKITDNNLKIYESTVNKTLEENNIQKQFYKKINDNEIEYTLEKSKNKRNFFIH